MTALTVGLAALVFLVLPATSLAISRNRAVERQLQVEGAEAQLLKQSLGNEARDVQLLLATQLNDRKLLDEGIERGRTVMRSYGIGDSESWLSEPKIARLPDDQRLELCSDLGEMLLLMSCAATTRADDPDRALTRTDDLATALRWTELAEQCFPDGTRPALLERVRGDLEKSLGIGPSGERQAICLIVSTIHTISAARG
jgi:hypothetical protein